MTMAAAIAITTLAFGLAGLALQRFGSGLAKYRGRRLVVCPETGQPAAVLLAAWRLAGSAIFRPPALRLQDCSRWRERAACGQPCLAQIEAAPEDCLARRILIAWYQDKSCIFCGQQLGQVDWRLHKPCVLSPEQSLFEWRSIQPERIPIVLQTHQPVCRTCFIAETHIL